MRNFQIEGGWDPYGFKERYLKRRLVMSELLRKKYQGKLYLH